MESSHFLLVAKVTCVKGFEKSLNAWYASHIPRRIEAPGFLWGFRYRSMQSPQSFLALYGIAGVEHLSPILNADIEKRYPILQTPDFNEPPKGISHIDIGVYKGVHREPAESLFLSTDSKISLETWDWLSEDRSSELGKACDEHYLQEMLNFPQYLSGHRYEKVAHPDITYTNLMPESLIVFEYAEGSLNFASEHPKLSRRIEPLIKDHTHIDYQLISKHWPLRSSNV